MSEYNNSTVGANACSYANLANYNSNYSLGVPIPLTTTSGSYIVPGYTAPSYSTLTHNMPPTCGGYFNIIQAYGKHAANCDTQYNKVKCGGNGSQ
jgi:hypothetical protein